MSQFIFPIIEIISGIILLFAGGELFIQGAIYLSLILGIPQIVIGLTVVSRYKFSWTISKFEFNLQRKWFDCCK